MNRSMYALHNVPRVVFLPNHDRLSFSHRFNGCVGQTLFSFLSISFTLTSRCCLYDIISFPTSYSVDTAYLVVGLFRLACVLELGFHYCVFFITAFSLLIFLVHNIIGFTHVLHFYLPLNYTFCFAISKLCYCLNILPLSVFI